jgi:diacylglycerol kinase (ATP)
MRPPIIQLFVNSRPGRRVERRVAALRAALEAGGATVLVTPSDTERLTIDDRADQACAVGGDGTLRHVVEAVHRAGRPVTVSAYPGGTVNLLARECGYPRAPEAFARRLLEAGKGRMHRTGLIGDIPLLACASVGPDSAAVAGLCPAWKDRIGRAAYVLAFLGVLARWSRPRIRLLHDGRETPCEAVYVAKGRFFAGPWSFAPDARVGSPLLHVVALRRATRMDFLRFVWTMLAGRAVAALPGVESFTCTELTLLSDDAPPLQADGDIVTHLPATIALRRDATRFA